MLSAAVGTTHTVITAITITFDYTLSLRQRIVAVTQGLSIRYMART